MEIARAYNHCPSLVVRYSNIISHRGLRVCLILPSPLMLSEERISCWTGRRRLGFGLGFRRRRFAGRGLVSLAYYALVQERWLLFVSYASYEWVFEHFLCISCVLLGLFITVGSLKRWFSRTGYTVTGIKLYSEATRRDIVLCKTSFNTLI